MALDRRHLQHFGRLVLKQTNAHIEAVAELSRETLTGAGRSGEPSPKGCDTASHGPLRSGPTLSFPFDDLGRPVES